MDPVPENKTPERTILRIQEGPAENYFRAFYQSFGGEISDHVYFVKNATVRVRINSYKTESGMELMLSEGWYENDLYVEKEPDGDLDYVHINLVLEGIANQSFKDREETLEARTVKGAFAYNGLFRMDVMHPAKQLMRSVSIKIRKDTI